MWAVSLVFEYNGGRSKSIDSSQSFDLMKTVRNLAVYLYIHTNRFFLIFSLLAVAFPLFFFFFNKKIKKSSNNYFKYGICFIYCSAVSIIFEILLCTKIDCGDIKRPDILFTALFYIFAITSIAVVSIMKRFNITYVLPIFSVIVICSVFVGGNSFAETNDRLLDHKISTAVDNYIVNTVKDADKNKQEQAEVHVPVFDGDGGNWPISTNMGGIISNTLYQHNIISEPIKVVIIPDVKMNKKFGIDIKYQEPVY